MAVVPSIQCFRLVHAKFLLTHQSAITVKLFLVRLIGKLLVDFKARKLSQLGYFLFQCPFKGGYFSSVVLEMGVSVRLRGEVPAYGRLEM